MIVNTELRDCINGEGKPARQLVVSYVNAQGGISFLTYVIPQWDMFNWRYAKRSDADVDPAVLSWDGKRVRRQPSDGYLDESRIHEILADLQKSNPALGVLHELNYPATAFCDIEVEVTDDGFPDAESARNPINTISWVHDDQAYVFGRAKLTSEQVMNIQRRLDEHCKSFKTKYRFTYVYHEGEAELLEDFFRNYVLPQPCITGWNFFGYDWPYMCNRSEKLGVDMTYLSPTGTWFTHKSIQKGGTGSVVNLPKHKVIYDYMEIYAKWDRAVNPKESNKLDWVSETVLGTKKVVHQLGFKDMWEQTPEDYVFYNAVDSILVREIDNTIKTSGAYFGLSNLMHVDQLTAFSPVSSLHTVQAEYQYAAGRVFPKTAKKDTKGDESYEGAYVYDPTPGIYHNVIALDYASLYPTTMRQFNISPDTFIAKDKSHKGLSNEITTASGAYYVRDREGFVPKILTDFYAKRKSYKKEMKIAIQEKYDLMDILEKRMKAAENGNAQQNG